jgi:hypothetical protein
MKRRTFLTTAVAAFATILAKPSLAFMRPAEPTLRDWQDHLMDKILPSYYPSAEGGILDTAKDVNARLIRDYPHLFRHKQMFHYVERREHPEHGPYTVVAHSKAMHMTYNYELAQDLAAVCGLDSKAEMVNILAVEAGLEFEKFQKSKPDIDMVFYVPLMPVRYVDPATFIPTIGFKSRFGNDRYPVVCQGTAKQQGFRPITEIV